LIDLSDVGIGDLAVLDRIESPVLKATLRRIRDEIENPTETVAGFNSCL
jgi:FXSXX-COOH protein